MSDDEPVHITCAHCDGLILTVPKRVADGVASGRWVCGAVKCIEDRRAKAAEEEGRLV